MSEQLLPRPILQAENICVQFGEFHALSGMSLRMNPNSIHALIGPNGAGKTSFFNAISGIRPPNSGTVTFDGRIVTKMPAHERVHQGMARSFQVTNIFPTLTVAENIRLAVQARHRREGWVFWRSPAVRRDILEEAQLIMERIGIASRAGMPAGELSHGGQRSLEIGMALGGRPKLICLDEPLAGMGIDDVQATKELILGLKADTSVLLIEHNMSVVLSISDRVTVMVQGKKVAEDAPTAIRKNEAVMAAYLGSQA
ncbi:ABC transporter ATP-binding protein [Rhizobium lentis]|uniref:ABC transporter ATP-binding protein n=1 Tax=Rhizobium lentis TaxID=1138194 RepID=A0ABS7IA57_9HYPH|nr:ABC transporter ATP-binding protein [Rhizobium lentis]MBX5088346.1 ABC transporter ATP-binding protein [Rhizobium lentis]